MILKSKMVLGNWPDLEGGNWMQKGCELFPPTVMLETGRKIRRELFPGTGREIRCELFP